MKKYIFLLILIINYCNIHAQKIDFGIYTSKKGSFLQLNKDKTFVHKKQQVLYTDIELIDRMSLSNGSFEVKNNYIIFKSNNNDSINNNIRIKGIKRNIKIGDSLFIKLTSKNDKIKTFICGTGLERTKNRNDYGGCFALEEGINKVSSFIPEDFHLRIYPNFESVDFRNNYSKINTIFFETKKFRNEIYSDLEIEIDFDTDNFLRYNFEEEIAIIDNNKIRFLGEDYFKK